MNNLKILKTSILSTALLSIVILIAMSFTMVVLPLAYYPSIAKISNEDVVGYSKDIADYCVINFYGLDNYQYHNLCKTFDMENFAGTVQYGNVELQTPSSLVETDYKLTFVSEKMVNDLPSLGYNFSKTKPTSYKEAYAPAIAKDKFEKDKIYKISTFEGTYKYEQTIKILGYTEKKYYNFFAGMTQSFFENYDWDFLIYDDIPPFAKIESGLMISDKTPEYYKSLGAFAKTAKQMNIDSKTSQVNDFFFYWCICAIVLFIVVVTANYYFAADKLIKRSGVMYIYGGKRSTIIYIEILKLLMLFIVAFSIATLTIGIVISETSYHDRITNEYIASELVDWKTHFTCMGIMFGVFIASISLGLTKFAKFKPLKAISNNNTEW